MQNFILDTMDLVSKYAEKLTQHSVIYVNNYYFYSGKNGITIARTKGNKTVDSLRAVDSTTLNAELMKTAIEMLKGDMHTWIEKSVIHYSLIYKPYYPRVNLEQILIDNGFEVSVVHCNDMSMYKANEYTFAHKNNHPGIIVCTKDNQYWVDHMLKEILPADNGIPHLINACDEINTAVSLSWASSHLDVLLCDYNVCQLLHGNVEV